jgi:hypothetical protein
MEYPAILPQLIFRITKSKIMTLKNKGLLLLIFLCLPGMNGYSQTIKTNAGMEHYEINESGELEVTPSATSSENDFDFLEGKWKVFNKKLRTRLNNCREWDEFESTLEMHKILTGYGNREHYKATIDNKAFEALAVRLYKKETRLWTDFWIDNNACEMDRHPVTGSFENSVGRFFAMDTFNGKNIVVVYQWDKTDPEHPVWSQAYSDDNGKTWEWNWFMHLTRNGGGGVNLNRNQKINVIELRNYVMKQPGQRDKFISYFEDNFIRSQNMLGGFTLGQYRVKGADNNFFWIRGFENMAARKKFLNDFYYGPVWKQHRAVPNSMLLNNDNVHLLKPLMLDKNGDRTSDTFNSNEFGKKKGVAVIDFYVANEKLDRLITFFGKTYLPLLHNNGIKDCSLWTSETIPNDFAPLPVFQDKNLLVTITYYADELDYQTKIKSVDSQLNEEARAEMHDVVTIKNTLILYPTQRSFTIAE